MRHLVRQLLKKVTWRSLLACQGTARSQCYCGPQSTRSTCTTRFTYRALSAPPCQPSAVEVRIDNHRGVAQPRFANRQHMTQVSLYLVTTIIWPHTISRHHMCVPTPSEPEGLASAHQQKPDHFVEAPTSYCKKHAVRVVPARPPASVVDRLISFLHWKHSAA